MRGELKKYGLPIYGRKLDLINRLNKISQILQENVIIKDVRIVLNRIDPSSITSIRVLRSNVPMPNQSPTSTMHKMQINKPIKSSTVFDKDHQPTMEYSTSASLSTNKQHFRTPAVRRVLRSNFHRIDTEGLTSTGSTTQSILSPSKIGKKIPEVNTSTSIVSTTQLLVMTHYQHKCYRRWELLKMSE